MPQVGRRQFIWKPAKGLMCCFTTAHVSPEYSSTDMTMHCELSNHHACCHHKVTCPDIGIYVLKRCCCFSSCSHRLCMPAKWPSPTTPTTLPSSFLRDFTIYCTKVKPCISRPFQGSTVVALQTWHKIQCCSSTLCKEI